MELRQLISFVRITQLGNLSAAAENLGYSQSAVTVQIRKLEGELGVRLFDRIGRRLGITEQGTRFLPYAVNVINEMNLARKSMEPTAELTGTLIIGAVESVMMFYVDRILRIMNELHPRVSFQIITGSPEELTVLLNDNRVDMIYVLEKQFSNDRWVKCLEKKEDIVFVSSPSRDICRKKNLRLEDLLTEPLILTEKNANYRRAFDSYTARHGLSVRPFMEISSTQYILQAVTEMKCVSLLPHYVVNDAVEKGLLCRLNVEGFSPEMYSQLFYQRDKWVTREMEEFICIAAGFAGVKAGPQTADI